MWNPVIRDAWLALQNTTQAQVEVLRGSRQQKRKQISNSGAKEKNMDPPERTRTPINVSFTFSD